MYNGRTRATRERREKIWIEKKSCEEKKKKKRTCSASASLMTMHISSTYVHRKEESIDDWIDLCMRLLIRNLGNSLLHSKSDVLFCYCQESLFCFLIIEIDLSSMQSHFFSFFLSFFLSILTPPRRRRRLLLLPVRLGIDEKRELTPKKVLLFLLAFFNWQHNVVGRLSWRKKKKSRIDCHY